LRGLENDKAIFLDQIIADQKTILKEDLQMDTIFLINSHVALKKGHVVFRQVIRQLEKLLLSWKT
jgi:hypothetical protein